MSYQCIFIRELKRKWWIIAIYVKEEIKSKKAKKTKKGSR